jgi:hypothetical protein
MWSAKPIRLVTCLWCVVGLLVVVGPIGLGLEKLGHICSLFLSVYVKEKQSSTVKKKIHLNID